LLSSWEKPFSSEALPLLTAVVAAEAEAEVQICPLQILSFCAPPSWTAFQLLEMVEVVVAAMKPFLLLLPSSSSRRGQCHRFQPPQPLRVRAGAGGAWRWRAAAPRSGWGGSSSDWRGRNPPATSPAAGKRTCDKLSGGVVLG
jgi:hypothetical protein